MNEISSNKRIATNTIFLYIRMIVYMVVTLYTTRILWKILGVENYGIYNVVGGVVLMFAFINNAMITSSQRYISFALGKGDKEYIHKIFSMSLIIHVLLALIILVLAESIGLWFLNVKLNIPEDRMFAANCVYQCSVVTFILSMITVPFNACIIAHEHMKVFGYFGILDVLLKLIVVLIVKILPFDPLICYSVLFLCVSGSMNLIYFVYCRRNFKESRIQIIRDQHLMREMFSFAGWSFLGNMGFSIRDQGVSILLNIFFNVSVNAAKGIANQVGNAVNGFASNFTMAINPQITKRYANGDIRSMVNLIYIGAKYSLLLMVIAIIPLIMIIPYILELWLGDIAPYMVGFVQIILIISLIESVVNPITTALQATGKIKKFQIAIASLFILNIPISWFFLKIGYNPYVVVYVNLVLSVFALIIRLILLHKLIDFSYLKFITIVYDRTIPIVIVSTLVCYKLSKIFNLDIGGIISYEVLSVIFICILIAFIGLTNNEKNKLFNEIKVKLNIS